MKSCDEEILSGEFTLIRESDPNEGHFIIAERLLELSGLSVQDISRHPDQVNIEDYLILRDKFKTYCPELLHLFKEDIEPANMNTEHALNLAISKKKPIWEMVWRQDTECIWSREYRDEDKTIKDFTVYDKADVHPKSREYGEMKAFRFNNFRDAVIFILRRTKIPLCMTHGGYFQVCDEVAEGRRIYKINGDKDPVMHHIYKGEANCEIKNKYIVTKRLLKENELIIL